MPDIVIAQRFLRDTERGKIVWKRRKLVEPTLLRITNLQYVTKFVDTDYVVISQQRYTDSSSFLNKVSFRLDFYDSSNYCYKTITGNYGTPIFKVLDELYYLIEEKINNFDNKLRAFFKD